jgi:hypothetical protein
MKWMAGRESEQMTAITLACSFVGLLCGHSAEARLLSGTLERCPQQSNPL